MADGRLLRFSLSLSPLIRNKSLSARSARVIEMDRRRVCPLCNARAYLDTLTTLYYTLLKYIFLLLYSSPLSSVFIKIRENPHVYSDGFQSLPLFHQPVFSLQNVQRSRYLKSPFKTDFCSCLNKRLCTCIYYTFRSLYIYIFTSHGWMAGSLYYLELTENVDRKNLLSPSLFIFSFYFCYLARCRRSFGQ